MTPEAKGLISLFHGQTECKKNKFGKLSEKKLYNRADRIVTSFRQRECSLSVIFFGAKK